MDVDGENDLKGDAGDCAGRAAHADPAAEPTPEQRPLPQGLRRKPLGEKSAAEWAYERLILYIRNFESGLDREHEIAMGFTDTGAGILRIEGIGYFDPDIVTFYGVDASGSKTQLVQHVTQLNVMLRAVRKPVEAAEPRRIGFRLAEAIDSD